MVKGEHKSSLQCPGKPLQFDLGVGGAVVNWAPQLGDELRAGISLILELKTGCPPFTVRVLPNNKLFFNRVGNIVY